MKITNVKLVNVASIYTGSGATELEVDLSESRNKIILLEGPNGCGKTSLLSCLHPFAYNGTLDERSTESLITPKKEGYKEVHIQNGTDEYVIKHFYSPSGTSHSVKSYIEKNGTELNPNGNVGSFKELVSLELDIEPDYLKLIRLGSNVTNFIPMKPTERKNFMGSLLDEVDIYLQYHKKVIADMRMMKTMIQTDTDKLRKLSINDINEVTRNRDDLRDEVIPNYDTLKQQLSNELAICRHELEGMRDGNSVDSDIERYENERAEIDRKLMSKKYKNLSSSSTDIAVRYAALKSQVDSKNSILEILVNDNNSLKNEHDDLEIKEEKLIDNEERVSLERIIDTLENEIKHEEKKFVGFKPAYTAEEMQNLIAFLEKCQTALSTTYEIGDKPIKKVIKLMRNMKDVPGFIEDRLTALYSNKMKHSGNEVLEYLRSKVKRIQALEKVDCKSECPYKDIYKEILSISGAKEDTDVESDSFYGYMNTAYNNINNVLKQFPDYEPILKRMPKRIQDMFTVEAVFDKISKLEWIYDIQILNEELSLITEYELLLAKKDKLKQSKRDFERLSDNSGLSFIQERIEEINAKIHANSKDIMSLMSEISEMTSELEELEDLAKVSENFENLTSRKGELDELIEELKNSREKIKEYRKRYSDYSARLNEVQDKYNRAVSLCQSYTSKIDEYSRLSEEMKKIQEDYDDWEVMRSTLSGKEGIPLVHIELYLKKTRKIVNELLDIVYGGELRIDRFDISADTFKIPYEKNGNIVSDARFASQGESSFMSIALSFALSLQSIKNYNIMLLDEIDSTLDKENRAKFIEILERMMDMANIEQIFMISHNNMFDMYPVDVIRMNTIKNAKITIQATPA